MKYVGFVHLRKELTQETSQNDLSLFIWGEKQAFDMSETLWE